jgi:hypothetical protein
MGDMCAFVSPHAAPLVLAHATDGMDARWHAAKLNLEGEAMIGTMLTFHPHQSQPVVAQLTAPPSLETVEGILGGPLTTVDFISEIEHQGEVYPCVAFCNEKRGQGLDTSSCIDFAKELGLDINTLATILLRKERLRYFGDPPPQRPRDDAALFGSVVVLFGDPDFMQAMKEGSAMQMAWAKVYEAEERRRAEEAQERARLEERPKANWKKRVLTAIGCGAVVGAFFAVDHFFGVPQTCGCRATVPPALSDARILDNSIGDARHITIVAAGPFSSLLTICYSEKPKQGKVDPGRFLPPEDCNWESKYDLEDARELGKSDDKVVIDYDVTERLYDPKNLFSSKPGKSKVGFLSLDRRTNSCRFGVDEWSQDWKKEFEKKSLSGQLKCASNNYYFNPWSWFPQSTELFYTRVFYAIHKQPNPIAAK